MHRYDWLKVAFGIFFLGNICWWHLLPRQKMPSASFDWRLDFTNTTEEFHFEDHRLKLIWPQAISLACLLNSSSLLNNSLLLVVAQTIFALYLSIFLPLTILSFSSISFHIHIQLLQIKFFPSLCQTIPNCLQKAFFHFPILLSFLD